MNKEEYLRRILREAYELGKNDGWEVSFNDLVEKWLSIYRDIESLEAAGVFK